MEGCVADKIGGTAVSSLFFENTTQNIGCCSDTDASAFSSGDDSGTSEGLCCDPAVFDAPSTSTASDFRFFCANSPTSVQDDQKEVPLSQYWKLIQSFKKIKAIDCLMQFCCLLIKADESSCSDAKLSKTIEKFLHNLHKTYSLIDIVETLLEVMQARKAKDCNELKSLATFFDLVKNPYFNRKISLKYLKGLSSHVKKLMEQFCDKELYRSNALIQEHEKGLLGLQNLLLKAGMFETYDILRKMYAFGHDNLIFSAEQKKEIESLLITAAKYIEKYVRNFSPPCKSRLSILDLQMRSSLQFFIDYFPNLTDESILKEIRTSKAILDDLILNLFYEETIYQQLVKSSSCIDYIESDEYDYEDKLKYEKEDKIRAELHKMPGHHTWWKEYIEIYFKKK